MGLFENKDETLGMYKERIKRLEDELNRLNSEKKLETLYRRGWKGLALAGIPAAFIGGYVTHDKTTPRTDNALYYKTASLQPLEKEAFWGELLNVGSKALGYLKPIGTAAKDLATQGATAFKNQAFNGGIKSFMRARRKYGIVKNPFLGRAAAQTAAWGVPTAAGLYGIHRMLGGNDNNEQ